MNTQAAVISLNLRRLCALFVFISVAAAFCYCVLLIMAVKRTAALSDTESSIQSDSGALASLENQYYSAEQALTPERAQKLGFVTASASSETFAEAPALALSLNGRN